VDGVALAASFPKPNPTSALPVSDGAAWQFINMPMLAATATPRPIAMTIIFPVKITKKPNKQLV